MFEDLLNVPRYCTPYSIYVLVSCSMYSFAFSLLNPAHAVSTRILVQQFL